MTKYTFCKITFSLLFIFIVISSLGREALFVATENIKVGFQKTIISKGDTLRADAYIFENDKGSTISAYYGGRILNVPKNKLQKLSIKIFEEDYYDPLYGTNLFKVKRKTDLMEKVGWPGKVVGTINKGEIVRFVRDDGSMLRIKYGDIYAYVWKKDLSKFVKLSGNLSIGSIIEFLMVLGFSDWLFYFLIGSLSVLYFAAKKSKLATNFVKGMFSHFIIAGIIWGILTCIWVDETTLFIYKLPLGYYYDFGSFIQWLSGIYLMIVITYFFLFKRRERKKIPLSIMVGGLLFFWSFLLSHRVIESSFESMSNFIVSFIIFLFIGLMNISYLVGTGKASLDELSFGGNSSGGGNSYYDVEVDFHANVRCGYYGYHNNQWDGCSKQYNDSGRCDAKSCSTGSTCNGGCMIINKSR